MIHAEYAEFAEVGVFLIKNSWLRASAVSSLLDRDNQNSHWEICRERRKLSKHSSTKNTKVRI